MSTFKCYKDICERGAQYCEKTRERCYWCKDASNQCWTTDMPRQCNEFCEDLWQQLKNQSYSRGYTDGISAHNGLHYPFIISTSIAVILTILCGLLGLKIYKLMKKLKTSRAGHGRYSVYDLEIPNSPETSPLTQTGDDEVVDMDITEPTDDAVSTNTTGRHASVDSGFDNRESMNSTSTMPCACNRDGGEAEACVRSTDLKQLPPRNDAGSLNATLLCG
ncbi:uncharacterized protein LOC124254643 [Haliotis rubra]|uniref:uncharacterized protein LOC124254643 n=1 Tax=Haliotis rubra TaxID=36100 RepID=UPI001EE577B7|nr:uncharacterized protein LOC124254643 [Haliotis rubra]